MLAKDSRNTWIRTLIAAVLFALAISPAKAQRAFAFRHVGIDAGLSHERVNNITMGSRGFLWVSTMWGLDNYDGYSISSVAPPDSLLCDGELLGAQEFGGDTMIVRHTQGYFLFIRSKMSFTPAEDFLRRNGAENKPDEVWVDGRRNMWMVEGHDVIYSQRGALQPMRIHLPDGAEVSSVCGSRYGIVVLLRDGRLLRCFPPADGHKPIPQFFSTPLASGARVMRTDMAGDLWVITSNGDSLWHKPMSRREWELINDLKVCGGCLPQDMNDVCVDTKNRIWIVSENDGATVIDPEAGKTYRLRRDITDIYSLRSNQCTCVTAFENGSVAVGYTHSGFSIYNPSAFKFLPVEVEPVTARGNMTDVRSIATDGRKYAFVGTNGGGLVKVNIATREASILPFPNTDAIGHVAALRDGSVWAYVNGRGFARYGSSCWSTARENAVCYFGETKGAPAPLGNSDIPGTVTTSLNGCLFAAAGSEILALPNAGDHNRVLEGRVRMDIGENVVTMRTSTDSSAIIVLTRDSFYKVSMRGGKMEIIRLTDYALRHERPSDICIDKKGHYWVATSQGVLLFVGGETDCGTELIDRKIFPQPPVSIAPGGRGGVVVATPTDLYMLRALPSEDSDSIRILTGHYRTADGRYSGVNSPRTACRMPDGSVWIGAELGVNEYIPASSETGQNISVEFSQLIHKGKYMLPGQEIDGIVAMTRPLPANRHITLPYSESSFSVTFTAINTPAPFAMSYSCEVLGLGQATVIKSEPRFALHDLTPGHYTLRVTAIDPDGGKSAPADLEIEVVQPWYAKTLTIVMAIGLAVIIIMVATFKGGARRGKRKGLRESEYGVAGIDTKTATRQNTSKSDGMSSVVLHTVAANVATSIGVLSDDLRSVSQTAGISIADSLTMRNLADRLNTANLALASVAEQIGENTVKTGSQFGGMGRHDLVASARSIVKQVSLVTHTQDFVGFATPLRHCVFDFDIDALRSLLVDAIVEAIVSTAGQGFVRIKVEKGKYAPGAATVTISIGGTQPASSIYFTADSENLALPPNIENCVKSLGATLITRYFGDGMTHLLINIPMKEA